MTEIWRKIENYENYMVSNLGNVKSLQRFDKRGVLVKEKILKQSSPKGYFICGLYQNQKCKIVSVSRLVAKAFPEICGEWFEGCEVHHKDHNSRNNCADNLMVVSPESHIEIHNKEEDVTHKTRRIFKYDSNWNLVDVFENTKIAAASVCGCVESLNRAIRDKKYYFGYYFVVS